MKNMYDIYRDARTDFKVVKRVTMLLQGFSLDESGVWTWGETLLSYRKIWTKVENLRKITPKWKKFSWYGGRRRLGKRRVLVEAKVNCRTSTRPLTSSLDSVDSW
jgi:hypothetical protein